MQDGIKRSLCYECDKFSSRDPRLEKVSQREDDRLMRRKKSCDSYFELCAEELNHRGNFQAGFFPKDLHSWLMNFKLLSFLSSGEMTEACFRNSTQKNLNYRELKAHWSDTARKGKNCNYHRAIFFVINPNRNSLFFFIFSEVGGALEYSITNSNTAYGEDTKQATMRVYFWVVCQSHQTAAVYAEYFMYYLWLSLPRSNQTKINHTLDNCRCGNADELKWMGGSRKCLNYFSFK